MPSSGDARAPGQSQVELGTKAGPHMEWLPALKLPPQTMLNFGTGTSLTALNFFAPSLVIPPARSRRR